MSSANPIPARIHAAIDLGSNTVRLLVAVLKPQGLQRLHAAQETTRLAEGLIPGRPLAAPAVDRTLAALDRYRGIIAGYGAENSLLGATMAARLASDGPAFLHRIQREFGFETHLLTGPEEARTTAAGVLTVLAPLPDRAVIFDLGGRSTEFVQTRGMAMNTAVSLALGSVGLTESFLRHDPPTPEEMAALRQDIRRRLDEDLPPSFSPGPALVGTAGTVTTLAAMLLSLTEYDPDRINNYRASRGSLEALFKELQTLPLAGRKRMPGLPEDRADIIVAGAAVVLEVLDWFSAQQLVVSDAGLLEGIWLAAAGQRSIDHHG
jgi:exopolyphosphatase/guanosine-5'-triphosphate,3'-diphosphate pyrophosphatase